MPQHADSPTDFLAQSDTRLRHDCNVHCYRASGPGGQKRNKTSSAVRLLHRPTGLTVVATESRSQHENRARAIRRLRETIALNVRRPVDVESYSVPEAIRVCLTKTGRFSVSTKNERYLPAVQAVLDLLNAVDGRVGFAAELLCITTASLTALLTRDGKLLAAANAIRARCGHKPLRG